MAPKKLTDCPENLREAIDWLIQIRHGNGKSDEGLGELTKALKKVIEEAIKEANTSFQKRENELNCAYIPNNNNCCDELKGKIEEAKTFSDSSKLLTAESALKKHRDADHSLSEDTRQRALKDVADRRNQLTELNTSLGDFTDPSKCNTLLTNLCSGLETFLGFDAQTKGYNGQGIVYSDLDRLCDAVMAFLHGVLEGVKDDTNVKHYDDLITDEKMQNVARAYTHLSSHLHDGSSGFDKNVTKVKQGITGYLNRMKALTDNIVGVSGVLKSLEDKICENIAAVGELGKKPLDAVVTTMGSAVYVGLDGIINKAGTAIKNLDGLLQKKIRNDFEKIQMKVEDVKENAVGDRWRMHMLKENVDKVLGELYESVVENVNDSLDILNITFTKSIGKIQDQIKEINDMLQQYIKELNTWISASDKIITTALAKINEILDGVKDGRDGNGGKNRKTLINEKATEMQFKADKLYEAYEQAKHGVQQQSQEAVLAINGLEKVYTEKLNSMKKNVDDKVRDVTQKLDGLKQNVYSGMNNLRDNQIIPAILYVIRSFKDGVGSVVSGDMNGHGSSAIGAQHIIMNFQSGLQSEHVPTLFAWTKDAMSEFRDAVSVLDNLKNGGSDGKFEVFRGFLNELQSVRPSVGTAQGKTFFDSLESDLKMKVKAAISAVKPAAGRFSLVFSDFHSQITGKGDDTVHGKVQAIKTQFDKDFSDGAIPQIKTQDEHIPNYSTNKNALTKAITDCITTGFQTANATIEEQAIKKGLTFSGLLTSITDELKKIAAVVDKDGDTPPSTDEGLKQFIEQLQTDIGKSTVRIHLRKSTSPTLEQLKEKISNLQREHVVKLDKTINTLRNKILPEAIRKCKSAIQDQVYTEVHNAKTVIKDDALKRYVTSKTKDLRELNAFVKERHEDMKKIIHQDRTSGIKGLLRNLKTVFHRFDHNNTELFTLTTEVRRFFESFVEAVDNQLDMASLTTKVDTLYGPLGTVFAEIVKYHHFHCDVYDTIQYGAKYIKDLMPQRFGDAPHPILDVFKGGFERLYDELQKTYVSRYSGRTVAWENPKDPGSTKHETQLTSQAAKCARVFLSIISTLYEQLYHLYYNCRIDWKIIRIDGIGQGNTNKEELKKYLEGQGYNTVNLINSENNGLKVAEKITAAFKHHYDFQILPDNDHRSLDQYLYFVRECRGPLSQLYWHLATYFRVCHLRIPDRKTYPCNIRDMLTWLCGLPYTRVYKNIRSHCNALLEVKNNTTQEMPNKTDKVINRILDTDLVYSLYSTIQISYSLLVAIQGHGRGFDKAEYPYACNFCDNSRNFYYPSDVTGLLDILREICQRLLRQLYFLYSRCRTSSRYQGWYDCPYGRDLPGNQWVSDQPRDQPNCPRKSPLQAYFMDGLSGCLPHEVTSIGCKSVCGTCPKTSPGMPCITPMGFWDLSNAASVTRQGSALHNVLAKFCHIADSPLCVLLRSLNCLIPYPPKSLGDMYAFYCNVMQGWYGSDYAHCPLFKAKINDAIKNAFPLPLFFHDNYDASQLTNKVRDLYMSANGHPSSIADGNHCDLWSISKPVSTHSEMKCSAIGPRSCASYLQPLGLHAHHTFAEKHASLYLSWCSYLAWDFWALLKSLLNAFKNMSCKSSGCSSCNCASGKHGVRDPPPSDAAITPKPGCHCKSIVDCKGVLSTFFQYGFTFRVPKELYESGTRKTCGDFVMQMQLVLQSKYFQDLFTQIDSFFFSIRSPFFWTLLTLWLLSLLYLIHIMVIRLDLLQIKSHLHSPSSHRIAAQSLLAAARVGKLAKITYLQP